MKELARLFFLQAGVLLAGGIGFLLIGSLIEALTPSPFGTILVILVCFYAGDRLLELEEQERTKRARRNNKNGQ